jgi:predicted RNA binding protein YcfA (HicA-like mRNA interferase family)
MTSTELIKLLEKNGWYEVAQKGSHKQFEHKTKRGKITVPHHKGKDIATGTLNSILKQAGLK